MKADIQAINFSADKKLVTLVENKMTKLGTFYDNILDANVNLKLEKSDVKENKHAEVKISVHGNELFSKKQSNSFEDAFDQAFEAVKSQLIRYKEKLRS
jgi:putative sigma-54 modulation protein